MGVAVLDARPLDLGPCADGTPRALVLRDADGDGFGTLSTTESKGCVGDGWVAFPPDQRLDCNDDDARATPDTEEYCDFDSDGAIGLDDCDDHNRRRYPGAAERCNGVDDDCDGLVDGADRDGRTDPDDTWALDEDGDGYPSETFLACDDPEPEFVRWPDWLIELDCAPLDPNVHPHRVDNCALQADANCDGVFSPVHVSSRWWPIPESIGTLTAQLIAAREDGAPTELLIPGDGPITIDLCPGTYRVLLNLGTNFADATEFVVRGHGASPGEVVLDAARAGRNVLVPAWSNFGPRQAASFARLENLTVTGGRAPSGEPGGCVLQAASAPDWRGAGSLTLDRVALRDCQADVGGAVAVESNNALVMTDVVFADASATTRGGAVDFTGTSLTMTGGSFSAVSAPAGAGAAIAATLPAEQSLSLQSVDLGAVTNDIALRTTGATVQRDLGDAANLVCTPAGCTP
jgi:hypothetical protein